jgi:hypothetical protein
MAWVNIRRLNVESNRNSTAPTQRLPLFPRPAFCRLLLDRDFFTRSFQLPLSFNLSAFGPGVAFFLEWFEFAHRLLSAH